MYENSANPALEYALKEGFLTNKAISSTIKVRFTYPINDMTTFDVTSLSSKGQIVIPSNVRKELGMIPGAKMLIFSDGVNVLIKPVQEPKMEKFKKLINESRAFMRKKNIKRSDVQKTIKQIRNENRS